jgi:type IV pilus assembly protein PilW
VKAGAALPTRVIRDHPKDGTEFAVQSAVGMRIGDVLIAVPTTIDAANWCSVLNVTGVATVGGEHRISHATGASGPWNTDPAMSVFPDSGYLVNSYLINAGQIVQRRYSISADHVLQESVGGSQTGGVMGAPVDLYPEIVNLQAMYGKDTNNDGVVDRYDNVTPATTAEWAQVLVVRVAVVARSGQFEKDEVSTAQPLWDVGGDDSVAVAGARTCGTSRCVELKVGDPAASEWKHYRYKVFEAVVPLRNVLWSS